MVCFCCETTKSNLFKLVHSKISLQYANGAMIDAQHMQDPSLAALEHHKDNFVKAWNNVEALKQESELQNSILINKINNQTTEIQELQEKVKQIQTSKEQNEKALQQSKLDFRDRIHFAASEAVQVLRPEALNSYVCYPVFQDCGLFRNQETQAPYV